MFMAGIRLPSFCKYIDESVIRDMENRINAQRGYNPCSGYYCPYSNCISHADYGEPVPEEHRAELEAWKKALRER